MRIARAESRSNGGARARRGRRAALGALSLAGALILALAPAAGADTGQAIINKCIHGQSLGGYTQQDYSRALQELPTEVEEYSNCGNLIRRAQLSAAGGRGGSGAGGAGAAPIPLTSAEQTALRRVPSTGAAAVSVGGQVIRPGVIHANVSSALSSLPTPLLAILALMLAYALAQAGGTIRHRVRARRSR